jgi:hypothetical protein
MSQPESIPYDINADIETNEQALLGALMSGRPLAIFASDAADVPPFVLGLSLSRVDDEESGATR